MPDQSLTPLGVLLERARDSVLRISVREASRRARISDARWRQVVTGVQLKAGGRVPVNPTPRTVVAMAVAVEVDPAEALRAAGIEASAESVEAMARDTQKADSPPKTRRASTGLLAEIERVKKLPIEAQDKIRIVNALIELYEEQAREGDEADRRALA